ncbi:tetratricopeptide repeat protein [Treponema sp. UBA3813]|uniref:tetratricopeptide repeat protein n=1 Tax=Treponema sp. UBA3813 TaxID=1947715 RepID=UPI0025FCFC99|nr:tetratricopeptide repeat protein [Treponema sp. UBA3813]
MSKKFLSLVFLSLFSCFSLFAQGASKDKLSAVESANLKQGADAYKNEDWVSAIFFLRKVVSAPGSANDENYFMLIKSEIYAGEYRQAQADCEKFLEQFAFSPYAEYVQYQKGRLLHLLARNEDAILSLSDFCHQNGESELYPLALFWIAESFYDEYNFEAARGLYERVVTDYSACEKAPQAQYKLDLIERRAREEKLLYLLKVIGEENLSTREEYERQLRVYALEDEKGVKKSLIDAQARIAELEALLESDGFDLQHEDETGIVVAEEPSGVSGKNAGKAETPESSQLAGSPSEKTDSQGKPDSQVEKAAQPITIIQSVSESSIRVKQNPSGSGTSAVTPASDASKSSDLQMLKRKAKQLQYLLNEQSAGEEK